MKKLLFGIAALPFVAGVAMADPVQLSGNQMDKVTAGWSTVEVDFYNSGAAVVGVYAPDLLPGSTTTPPGCGVCYLNIRTPTIQLYAWKPGAVGETGPFGSPPIIPLPTTP